MTPAKDIKRDLCRLTGLRPSDIRVKWGRGSAHGYLSIKLANDRYADLKDDVREYVVMSDYGHTFWWSDSSDDEHPAVSVTDMDGRQMLDLTDMDLFATAETAPTGSWLTEGF